MLGVYRTVEAKPLIVFYDRRGSGAGFAVEQPIEGAAYVVFAGFSQDAGDDLALVIEDEGGVQFVAELCAIEHVEVGAEPDLHREGISGEELVDGSAVFGFVGGDGDEANLLAGIFLIQAGEEGKFFATGTAPGGPEIYNSDGAAEVGDFLRFAGEVFEFEIRSALGLRGGHEATGEKNCEKAKGKLHPAVLD